jgi:hypothetical protein
MIRTSEASYHSRPPFMPSDQHTLAPDRDHQTHEINDDQANTKPTGDPNKPDKHRTTGPMRAEWAVSYPSKHLTVSAETKARWELLRALAGVQNAENVQTPKSEVRVKDVTQTDGPAPYEIVAAQVLKASTAPPLEPNHGSTVAEINRRNASHGRRPRSSGVASQSQAQIPSGSHRLRPLMLPKMVSRSNSGRRAAGSGHAPIVHPSTVPGSHLDGNPSPPRPQQEAAPRPSEQQWSSQSGGAKHLMPFRPSDQIFSGLAFGLSAASQGSNTAPHSFASDSLLAFTTLPNTQDLRATKAPMHCSIPPTAYNIPSRSDLVHKKPSPVVMLAATGSQEHHPRRETTSKSPANSAGAGHTPSILLADKSPEDILVLLASGDPDVLAFVYTDEGIDWLINSTYNSCRSIASDFAIVLTSTQWFFMGQCYWRRYGLTRICFLKKQKSYWVEVIWVAIRCSCG